MGNEIKYFNKSVLSFMKLIIEKGIEVNNNLNGIVLKKNKLFEVSKRAIGG